MSSLAIFIIAAKARCDAAAVAVFSMASVGRGTIGHTHLAAFDGSVDA
jgi:hypothetical protein